MQDALVFIRDELNDKLEKHETAVRVDPKNVAVSGASGGGCVAYYAVRGLFLAVCCDNSVGHAG